MIVTRTANLKNTGADWPAPMPGGRAHIGVSGFEGSQTEAELQLKGEPSTQSSTDQRGCDFISHFNKIKRN